MLDEEDKKRPIPEKFRASADPNDKAAFARLAENDAKQRDLSERIASPFARVSPRQALRNQAERTISTLGGIHRSDHHNEQLAEAFAILGRFDVAAAVSPKHKDHYSKLLQAVLKDDSHKCPHTKHHFVRARIWSVKHGEEIALLSCNVPECDWQNATPEEPDHIQVHAASQTQHQGQTKGMSISDAKSYHQNSVKKNVPTL